MGMTREEALRALAQFRDNRIVVSTMQVVTPWHALSPSPLNMTCIGFMGGASSLALGIAVAQPDKRVVVLDGDGSLLMQLGSLATIAGAAPRNFHHVLFQNGVYETSGSQPIAPEDKIDFAGMARAAGYRAAYSFDDPGRFREELPSLLDEEGPIFVCIKIDLGPDMTAWDRVRVDVTEESRALKRALASSG